MKNFLQILFFILIWFANLNARPIRTKGALPSNNLSFSKIENESLQSELKIGISYFVRSSISENSFSQKANFWERSVLEKRAREIVWAADVNGGQERLKTWNNYNEAFAIESLSITAVDEVAKKLGSKYNIINNIEEFDDVARELNSKIVVVSGAGSWIDEITGATKTHVLKGEINGGSAVGCHFKGALDNGTARIRPGATITEGTNDMFKVHIDVKDVNGNWIPKTAQSSFFPRTWSEQKILTEIQNAFTNKTFVSGNTWKGLSSEGIEIRMFLKTDGTNQIISAFPIF